MTFLTNMAKQFKIGDSVYVRKDSEYYYQASGVPGIVTDTDYRVKWLRVEFVNGYRNSYQDKDLELTITGETKMARRTFKLLKDSPQVKKGALYQEACDDGDQKYVLITPESLKFEDHGVYFNDAGASRDAVEKSPKWFVEVFPASETYLTKAELEAFKKFMKKATSKTTVKKR